MKNVCKLGVMMFCLLALATSSGKMEKKTGLGEEQGYVIFVMDDPQYDWAEDVAVEITQLHIGEDVDLVLNVIPYNLEQSTILGPNLTYWNNNYQGFIEIAEHGYDHSEHMDTMSYEEQRASVQNGMDTLAFLGITPLTYTPPRGEQNDVTLQVLADLGFHTDFDAWSGLASTNDILVLKQGDALLCASTRGKCNFKDLATLMEDIDTSLTFYGYSVVAFHYFDFIGRNGLDNSKYLQYKQLLQDLKATGKYQFVTAEEYYQIVNQPVCECSGGVCCSDGCNYDDDTTVCEARECDNLDTVCRDYSDTTSYCSSNNPNEVCQYAASATATEEDTDRLAVWASGAPDCSTTCDGHFEGDCSWAKTYWANTASIDLTYTQPVNAFETTVLYDSNPRLDIIQLWDGTDWITVHARSDNTCPFYKSFTSSFMTDTVRITSIANDWSAIDAVELCGYDAVPVTFCPTATCETYTDAPQGTPCGDNFECDGNGACVVIPVCCNGIVEGFEQCDDGNLIDGDGCNREWMPGMPRGRSLD